MNIDPINMINSFVKESVTSYVSKISLYTLYLELWFSHDRKCVGKWQLILLYWSLILGSWYLCIFIFIY